MAAGAANDEVEILEGTAAGAQVAYFISLDGEPRVRYFDPPIRTKPMIDFSACTLSAGHKVVFTLAG